MTNPAKSRRGRAARVLLAALLALLAAAGLVPLEMGLVGQRPVRALSRRRSVEAWPASF